MSWHSHYVMQLAVGGVSYVPCRADEGSESGDQVYSIIQSSHMSYISLFFIFITGPDDRDCTPSANGQEAEAKVKAGKHCQARVCTLQRSALAPIVIQSFITFSTYSMPQPVHRRQDDAVVPQPPVIQRNLHRHTQSRVRQLYNTEYCI